MGSLSTDYLVLYEEKVLASKYADMKYALSTVCDDMNLPYFLDYTSFQCVS